jgi:hypothetical protein
VRVLPKLTNSKSGYRIAQNQVRFEASEKDIAGKVAAIVNSEINQPLIMGQISYKTPNYISIFIKGK